MNQHSLDAAGNPTIALTPEEAQALVEMHDRRLGESARPTLRQVAETLGISEPEAMALLTEMRAQTASHPPAFHPPVEVVAAPAQHRVPGYVWGVVALVALGWIGFLGYFFFGPSESAGAAVADEPGIHIRVPTPPDVRPGSPVPEGGRIRIRVPATPEEPNPPSIDIKLPNGDAIKAEVDQAIKQELKDQGITVR